MKPWTFEQLRPAAKSKWLHRGTRAFNGRICTDSRKLQENDLFIALVGKNHDAHTYLADVLRAGASGVLVHREPSAEVMAVAREHGATVLQTEDTLLGLNHLAAAYRTELRAKVIAVGGSNGKTTTKRIIHALLSERFGEGGGHASPKSFNNNIGMPLTLLEVEPKHEFVVLEIGTNAPGEIAALGEVCRPEIAVITSIGLEHLERLGDLDGVAREEASITGYVAAGGTLVYTVDAPELLAALHLAKVNRITIGRGGKDGADLALTDVVETRHGTTFTVNGRGGYRLPLLGEHNAANALLAIAVARRLGLTEEQIQAGLSKVQPAPMRLELIEGPANLILNDAYNANPSSMAASLQTFARLQFGGPSANPRRVAVLGDMLELGPASEAMHRNVGALLAAWKIPVFIAVGPAMQVAADVAAVSGVQVHRFPNTAAACQQIRSLLQDGDAVLLKGSRGMALETVLAALVPSASVRVPKE